MPWGRGYPKIANAVFGGGDEKRALENLYLISAPMYYSRPLT
jgi:hypothetical protein